MRPTKILLIAAMLTSATAHAADDAASISMLDAYREKALGAKFSMWSGLKLVRRGKEVKLGFFGGAANDVFEGSPGALDAMSTYRTLRIAGTALWAAGLVTLLTEMTLLLAQKDLFIEETPLGNSIKPLFWAMLISGSVVGITGGVMMQGANGYLSDAIQRYNDDLAKKLKGNAASRRRVMFSYRGRF